MRTQFGVVVEPLSDAERAELAALEIAIKDSLRSFAATGERLGDHLARIRDGRLYRECYATFESYCQAQFGLGRSRAYQLIDLVEVRAALSTGVDAPAEPVSDLVARQLAPLRDEPEAMREVWAEAVQQHGPRPTPTQIREIVRGPEPPPRKDMRFELVEDAVSVLQGLPDADAILWPVDQEGDIEMVDEALAWLSEWLPRARGSWRRHKAEIKLAKRAAAMGNGTRP